MKIPADDPIAAAIMLAIRGGDVGRLRHLLAETPALAMARIIDDRGCERTLLHVAADWPGHFPNGAATVAALVAAGAELNASMNGPSSGEKVPKADEGRLLR